MKGSKYATGDRVAEAQVAEARSSLGKGGSTPRAADGQGAFHAWTIDETLSALSTSEEGLCNDEARARLVREGPNRLTRRGGPSALRKFLAQFGDPLVVVLIVASIVSFALGEVVDALVIFAVVFANAVIGFYQERRAEQAILALDDMITTEATVLRDGERVRLPSEELVRGDVVLLQSGDTVPADLRLIQVRELQVEEAALTGESVPVQKAVDPLPADTFLGDRQNLAFAGTAVTYGQACGVVVATGDHTETGRIAGMLSSVDALVTPLTRRIAALSRLLVWSILAVAAALFAVEALRGSDLVTTFNAAVALAVGAIPEGLPAAVTVLLAVGVSTMAKRNALIRKLPAVETLGSTTVICSDKTGTLTENQMMVTTLVVGGEEYQVSGQGYAPTGSFMRGGKDVVTVGEVVALVECLRAGALCNDTIVRRGPEGVKVEGDPTEAALLVAAEKAGLNEALHAFERVDSVPFESQHMYMATLHRVGERMVAYVKGSSDVLLGRCRAELTGDGREVPCDRARLEAKVEKLAERGLRVLVMAKRELGPDVRTLGHDDIRDLTFVGLVGMVDPPRAAAKSAVAACQGAGIRVKMITGDHARTASAIASELGLEGKRDARGRLVAVTGHELGQLDDHALAEQADDVAVFARVAPEQKLKLVKALQKRGHVVAMTGDGVNDAPALRQADIGVAMGKSGTDVARSAAAMVLTDDDFATIAAAVEEGRGVYDNLVKFMAWTLPTNGGEAMVLFLAVLLRAELPVLPVQLLWINLATAVLLGIALVFEPKEPGLMQRPPRAVNQPLLDGSLLARIVLISALMAVASFTFFKFALARGTSVEAARTIVVNTIVVLEVAYLFACRSLALPFWRIGAFANPYVWYGSVFMLLTQLLFTYAPIMNRLFHTAPIEPFWWLVFSGAGVLVLVLAELIKLFTHRSA